MTTLFFQTASKHKVIW